VSTAHRPVRTLRRPSFRWRPTLQRLEDRTTPATLTGLGTAGQFAIFDINGGQFSITGSSIAGNVGIGPNTSGNFNKTTVTGVVDIAHTADAHLNNPNGKVSATGGIVTESLAQAQSDAKAASKADAAQAPTQTFGNRTASLTLIGNGGTNVIGMTSLDFAKKTLTLVGGANDVFVFNVTHDFTFDHSQIVLTGGVTANHVLFNFTKASTIDITDSSTVVGTFLAPKGSVELDNSSFQGELIAKNLVVHSDQNLTAAAFTLTAAKVATASLSGFVYADMDFSGTRDAGDVGVSDVTVTLTGKDAQGNTVNLTTETASDGSYSFANLAPGTYQVTETPPSGYSIASNTVGTVNGAADGSLVGTNAIGSIVLAGGNAGVEFDFGVEPPGA
jgi:choice-of-anchor A domain-containing protein